MAKGKRKFRGIFAVVFQASDGICPYCGIKMERFRAGVGPRMPYRMTIDHKTPRSHGGMNDLDNLHIACLRCNNEKGDMDHETYLAWRQGKKINIRPIGT